MPRYPKAPIASGKTEKIRVTYLPKGRPGEFNKSVKVRTNDPKNKKVTLRISGVVVPWATMPISTEEMPPGISSVENKPIIITFLAIEESKFAFYKQNIVWGATVRRNVR